LEIPTAPLSPKVYGGHLCAHAHISRIAAGPLGEPCGHPNFLLYVIRHRAAAAAPTDDIFNHGA
jgi:hypothetical protein